ncbi:MAG TPA: P-loop NTPase [Acidimicrobiales bacterium]|nr:P-loop NTPase [Acidimicrobiales bacterium]
MPTTEDVRGALLGVIDPELGDNVVDLGMVRDVAVGTDGFVTVTIALTVAGCPLQKQLRADIDGKVGAVPGVSGVAVRMGEMDAGEKAALMARARAKAQDRGIITDIPATTRILAVASGKGGVGKSSVTANLAVSLALRGLTVGVLDADIWGFSLPRMLGVEGQVVGEDRKMVPIQQPVGEGRLKVLSMGLIGGAAEDQAIMWRGLILNRAVQHFLEDVRWGELDYLLIDMPPGTGDVQMGLARMLPRADMVIVTTPALAAQKVAARAADMARRGYLRVAGVVENMTAFRCDHGEEYPLFGSGGGERLANELGVPLLGQVPIEPAVARGGDEGRPAALGAGPAAGAFHDIAARIVLEVAPLVELTGCTARMLDNIERAVAPKAR